MSQSIVSLQKTKIKMYKDLIINDYLKNLNKYIKNFEKYQKLCVIIHKKCYYILIGQTIFIFLFINSIFFFVI